MARKPGKRRTSKAGASRREATGSARRPRAARKKRKASKSGRKKKVRADRGRTKRNAAGRSASARKKSKKTGAKRTKTGAKQKTRKAATKKRPPAKSRAKPRKHPTAQKRRAKKKATRGAKKKPAAVSAKKRPAAKKKKRSTARAASKPKRVAPKKSAARGAKQRPVTRGTTRMSHKAAPRPRAAAQKGRARTRGKGTEEPKRKSPRGATAKAGVPASQATARGGRRTSGKGKAKKEEAPLPILLRSLGFFPSRGLFREFEKVYKKQQRRDTVTAALEALDRAGVGYWYDDLMVDEPEVYIEHLRRVALLTRRAFRPTEIEVEEIDEATLRLSFSAGDRSFQISLRAAESIDDVPIIMAVNQYFDERGFRTRLGLYTGQDQAGFIAYGPIRGLLRLPNILNISWGVRRDASADLLAVESTDLSDWPDTPGPVTELGELDFDEDEGIDADALPESDESPSD